MRIAYWLAASAMLLAAGCAEEPGPPRCYKILESSNESGARALMVTPCPPGRHGLLKDGE
ncbi:MAG TPA: hypothetical protein VED46_06930 [Alphaproteobacteria bacterium]|nr:hypothetical protein [Alphaproteobacteria bacterium]